MLGDDDSIYMSLGEIPISMLKILATLLDLNLVIELSLNAMPSVCARICPCINAVTIHLILSMHIMKSCSFDLFKKK